MAAGAAHFPNREARSLVDGVADQLLKGNDAQRTLFRRAQRHSGGKTSGFRFGETRGAEAPAVALFQTREAASWRHQVVALSLRVVEKRIVHASTHDVGAAVAGICAAASVAKPPRHRFCGAGLEGMTQYIFRVAHAAD